MAQTEDIMEKYMTVVSSVSKVRGLDSEGNSVLISLEDLEKKNVRERGVYEGNVDDLTVNGIYYLNGHTLNAPSVGLLLVLKVEDAVAQIAFDVFSGNMLRRARLYNNGNWNLWTQWA